MGKRRKCRPRRELRAGKESAKIFFKNPESGQTDGHSGAHESGCKPVLTVNRAALGCGRLKSQPRAGVVHLAGVREVPVAIEVLLVPRPVPRLAERPLLVPPQGRDAAAVPVPFLGPGQAAPAVDRVRRVEDPGFAPARVAFS